MESRDRRLIPKRACTEIAPSDAPAPKKKNAKDASETARIANLKKEHKERFSSALEHHILRKDKLVVRFTRDNIFRTVHGDSIRHDLSWVFCAENNYVDSFVIGDKFKCFFVDEKGQDGYYTCLFQGAFPSLETAESHKSFLTKAYSGQKKGSSEGPKRQRKRAVPEEDGEDYNAPVGHNVRALTASATAAPNALLEQHPTKPPSFLEMRRRFLTNPVQSTQLVRPQIQSPGLLKPNDSLNSSGISVSNGSVGSGFIIGNRDQSPAVMEDSFPLLDDSGYVPSNDVRALTSISVLDPLFEINVHKEIAQAFGTSASTACTIGETQIATPHTARASGRGTFISQADHNETVGAPTEAIAVQLSPVHTPPMHIRASPALRLFSTEVTAAQELHGRVGAEFAEIEYSEDLTGLSDNADIRCQDSVRALTGSTVASTASSLQAPATMVQNPSFELPNGNTAERDAVREARFNSALTALYGEKYSYLFRYPSERKIEARFKTPWIIPQSSVRLFDSKAAWFFQIKADDKEKLVDVFEVYVDKDYRLLVHEYLHNDFSLTKYIWYLMLRMLGGEAGLRRVASLYELHKEKVRSEDSKGPYSVQEKILGTKYFRAIESHVQQLLHNPARSGRARKLPASYPTFLTEKMLNWAKRLKLSKETAVPDNDEMSTLSEL